MQQIWWGKASWVEFLVAIVSPAARVQLEWGIRCYMISTKNINFCWTQHNRFQLSWNNSPFFFLIPFYLGFKQSDQPRHCSPPPHHLPPCSSRQPVRLTHRQGGQQDQGSERGEKLKNEDLKNVFLFFTIFRWLEPVSRSPVRCCPTARSGRWPFLGTVRRSYSASTTSVSSCQR